MLVCGHLEKSLDILTHEFNFDEREVILEKFVMAKTLRSCRTCLSNEYKESSSASPNIVELVLSGYIECRLCRYWFHRMCCSEQLSNLDNDLSFVCENCTKLFVIQVQTDNFNESAAIQPNSIMHHIKQVTMRLKLLKLWILYSH
jgi:hypothetical protein